MAVASRGRGAKPPSAKFTAALEVEEGAHPLQVLDQHVTLEIQ
jgi:hypothetical protein